TLRAGARLIAATNRNLHKDVERGRFREDLFFRINVFEIYVPPLRERKEDIVPLVEQFLGEMARKGRSLRLGDKVRAFLLEYPFPGNVRELHNIIERAAVLTKGSEISMDAISVRPASDAAETPIPLAEPVDLDRILADTERRYLQAALEKVKGKRAAAAVLLGITERSLRYRMDKLNLRGAPDDE
ncbi:MAG TPA: helix-turn-helix domain-containing protein, partial [bacterium]|nr:helix-turn-helix domain-containing protein [bacterium]